MSDPVNHPSHYASSKIEVIEAIEAWELGFHLGNAIKYAARAGKKDQSKEIEDLQKAIWYVNRWIALKIAEKENREPVRPNDMHKADEWKERPDNQYVLKFMVDFSNGSSGLPHMLRNGKWACQAWRVEQ